MQQNHSRIDCHKLRDMGRGKERSDGSGEDGTSKDPCETESESKQQRSIHKSRERNVKRLEAATGGDSDIH